MSEQQDWLAAEFEQKRTHLKAVAYRMLGSVSEADDAVQETWLRISRADTSEVVNLGGWMTTAVSRVCLNMLRSRRQKAELPLVLQTTEPVIGADDHMAPEYEAELADSVGIALLVVLERLTPAERLAFVLHDTFGVPFDEIAPIVGRSPDAARQLASRARRRVRGGDLGPVPDQSKQRQVVEAFLAASRAGDFEALVSVLDEDVVLRADVPVGHMVRGARQVARQARRFSARGPYTDAALVDGEIGMIVAFQGQLVTVAKLRFDRDRIAQIDFVTDPLRLSEMKIAALEG